MRTLITSFALAAALTLAGTAVAQTAAPRATPTIVLVHGSLGDPASFGDLLTDLTEGAPVPAGAYDLGDATGTRPDGRDDVSTVARSISVQLVPIGALYRGPLIVAATGTGMQAPFSPTDRQVRAR